MLHNQPTLQKWVLGKSNLVNSISLQKNPSHSNSETCVLHGSFGKKFILADWERMMGEFTLKIYLMFVLHRLSENSILIAFKKILSKLKAKLWLQRLLMTYPRQMPSAWPGFAYRDNLSELSPKCLCKQKGKCVLKTRANLGSSKFRSNFLLQEFVNQFL